MGFDYETRIRNVTAVLGPTNTGKTHLAIERMLGHDTGMIGLPLRLLAREVYDKIAARIGADKVALVTGEEKIKPEIPRFWVSTVEAMPRDVDVDFLAIDEIQLAADPERGHVFTDRLLNARGKLETLLLGAGTMRDCIADLVEGANFITRPRLSKLTYTGQKKITRLPARSAIVAFSANEVYAIAELIRRQRGGAAVVLGALSPRTRNSQVALYQSGDVDFLVATDAIGMGLNLDVNHVAFSAIRKFDGQNHRMLTPAELAQIAGRAGRHMNDGTFGVTGDVEPFEQDVVERLETHNFDTVKTLQWRARKLEFSSLHALRESLRQMPSHERLQRARMADDVLALEIVSHDREIEDLARAPAAIATLWDLCQIPDYRKISSQNHAELIGTLYKYLIRDGQIPDDWFQAQVSLADRTDGDIDTLANRIAHIRTWTFVSNRPGWLRDPAHWQERTRAIEDSLSDALHERLMHRFVDRRTSALMKGLRDKDELTADISDDGTINVESHYVGRIKGFRFAPDGQAAEGVNAKAARNAAAQVVTKEMGMRARRVIAAKNDAFKLTRQARIQWRGEDIARLEPGDNGLKPQVVLIADDYLQSPDREKVHERLVTWINDTIADKLKPLVDLATAEDISGLARGIAFRMVENFGALKRDAVADEISALDQTARAQLRKYAVRFGAFNIFIPLLLKPASAELTLTLWLLKHAAENKLDPEQPPEPPRAGLTSVAATADVPEPFYRANGYHLCGPRAVRMDILERLADLIRPLLAWRLGEGRGDTPPKGATGDGAFTVTQEMMSILGCSPDELGNVLKALGFRVERRPKRARPAPTVQPAPSADAASAVTTGAEAPAADASPTEGAAADAPPQPVTVIEPAAADLTIAPGDAPVVPAEQQTEETAAQIEAAPSPTDAPADDGQTTGSAAADAAAEPSADAAASSEEQPAEPEMEEVWRPRRRREPGQRNRGHRGERGDRRGPNPNQGQRPGQPGDRPPHHRRGPRPDRGPQPAPTATDAPVAATTEGGAAEPGRREDRRPRRPDRPRHDQGQPGQRREGQPQGGRDQPQRRPEGDRRGPPPGRDDRRRDDRRRDNRQQPQVHTASPQKKGGTVDPDSPFAALSALKAALEKRQDPTS